MPRFLLPFLLISFLSACGGSEDSTDPDDLDGDGVPNELDAFPRDAKESVDTDGDGIGDNSDPVRDTNFGDLALGTGVGTGFINGVMSNRLDEWGWAVPAYGSTTVEVSIVDKTNENQMYLGLVTLQFISTCSQLGLAYFTPALLQASGIAAVTYQDNGCGKTRGVRDNIVAFIASEDESGNVIAEVTARTTIDVEPTIIGEIQFIEALPNTIALKGFASEATPSLSAVSFQVLDAWGAPLAGHEVLFELDHEYAGASLIENSCIADEQGKVTAMLSAGYAAGPMKVNAKVQQYGVDDNLIDTFVAQSNSINISSSLGNQGGFNISTNKLNPHSWDEIGNQIDIAVHWGDQHQNPVLDGTIVNFKTSGGLIDDSCETLEGACSVKWSSGIPKPVDGYVTILAYASGQGDFQDKNDNGLFDIGENYITYGEAWLDANGNGSFDGDDLYQTDLDIDNDGTNDFDWNITDNFYERVIDANSNEEFDPIPGTKYQGINCSEEAKSQGHCTELMDVNASLRLQMSAGNDALIEGPFLMDENGEYDYSQTVSCIDGRSGQANITWRVADSLQRRNHVPMGTKITYQVDNVTVTSEKGTGDMPSTKPADVLPVWEAISVNAALTSAQRKEKYLNERGSLIEVGITKPDEADPAIEFGTINLVVETLDGIKRSPDSELRFDILGNTCPAP